MTDAVTPAGMSSLGYEAVGAQVEYAFERCGGIWRLANSSVFDGDRAVDCRPASLGRQGPGHLQSPNGFERTYQPGQDGEDGPACARPPPTTGLRAGCPTRRSGSTARDGGARSLSRSAGLAKALLRREDPPGRRWPSAVGSTSAWPARRSTRPCSETCCTRWSVTPRPGRARRRGLSPRRCRHDPARSRPRRRSAAEPCRLAVRRRTGGVLMTSR